MPDQTGPLAKQHQILWRAPPAKTNKQQQKKTTLGSDSTVIAVKLSCSYRFHFRLNSCFTQRVKPKPTFTLKQNSSLTSQQWIYINQF